ncbi:hypothetical protein MKQ68_04665 [Chitinophaga horti]|uniref:Uncharacterized protein n=1 Tax=Chitinophaga horti TaxID=2920382 RepID=A0ABY6J4U3_9BACT|nr:hypothetical protein [Chitinophaga horti]UYQ94381.1 hypothetical protein MKQ68_04665 [Chitinophaga horti]
MALRKVLPAFDNLDKLKSFIDNKSGGAFNTSIQIDQWVDYIVDANKRCLVIKRSASAGAKVVFVEPNVVDIQPIAPGQFFSSFRRGIPAFVVHLFISGGQWKVAHQVEEWILDIQQ